MVADGAQHEPRRGKGARGRAGASPRSLSLSSPRGNNPVRVSNVKVCSRLSGSGVPYIFTPCLSWPSLTHTFFLSLLYIDKGGANSDAVLRSESTSNDCGDTHSCADGALSGSRSGPHISLRGFQ